MVFHILPLYSTFYSSNLKKKNHKIEFATIKCDALVLLKAINIYFQCYLLPHLENGLIKGCPSKASRRTACGSSEKK